MPGHSPPPQDPPAAVRLPPELLDYVTACVRAAGPSGTQTEALRALGALVEDAWEMAAEPVDWDELEREAERQGCTVADVVFDRAGRRPDAL